ncbi:hypothetical protein HYQ45_007132 [Verticillium longisporum]|uniref:Uncharacterized protein n=1 Tax=Verticillium longisporum TaxID=100787 RepID=A0A8I3AQM7_VERLO|nr:hypothetical protein HYQ45_007132 [Verticillium longisporum]
MNPTDTHHRRPASPAASPRPSASPSTAAARTSLRRASPPTSPASRPTRSALSSSPARPARPRRALPFAPVASGFSEIKKSEIPAAVEGGAFKALRHARSEKRNQGKREKRAKDKADAEAAAKK